MPPPYLIDTDHCVPYLQGSHPAHGTIGPRIGTVSAAQLRISIFTVMELAEGPWHSQFPQGYHLTRLALHRFLSWIPVVGITHITIEHFGRIRAELRKQGQLIGDIDTAIAATALENGFTLVTHNTVHFSRIQGLQLEDWYP